MNTNKIFYWVGTAMMCGIMAFSAQMYLLNYEMVTGFYEHLGFPTWMIYPSAILKIGGILAIITRISPLLKEWAYAGFFFDLVMAFTAHQMVGDGASSFAIIGLVGLVISKVFEGRVYSDALRMF